MAEQGTHTTVCTALGLPGADSLDLREWKTQIADRWDAISAYPVRSLCTQTSPSLPAVGRPPHLHPGANFHQAASMPQGSAV